MSDCTCPRCQGDMALDLVAGLPLTYAYTACHWCAPPSGVTQQFYVGKPDIDGSCIREWRFTAGEGESEVELCLPDETSAAETPMIFIAGRDGFTLEELEAFLPNLLAVLNDRRVLAARQRMAEGMPPVDDREAA